MRACSDWIVVAGDRVKTPRPLAGLGVVGVDEAADAVLGAADPDDDLPLDHQGSHGRAIGQLVDIAGLLPPLARHSDRHVPDLFAAVAVEADQMGVECRHVELVAPGGETRD